MNGPKADFSPQLRKRFNLQDVDGQDSEDEIETAPTKPTFFDLCTDLWNSNFTDLITLGAMAIGDKLFQNGQAELNENARIFQNQPLNDRLYSQKQYEADQQFPTLKAQLGRNLMQYAFNVYMEQDSTAIGNYELTSDNANQH